MLMARNAGEPNAPGGARFRGGRSGPIGRSRMKSRNTSESPTGYRSRGPSAERQARKIERLRLRNAGR